MERIEQMLGMLVGRQNLKQWYTVEEFARLVGRSPFTCRQWCRRGRILARKKDSGRGAHSAWAISQDEYQRYQREGLRRPGKRPIRIAAIDVTEMSIDDEKRQ
jgi:hypothetical protein